jgi:hypothetical protein
MTRLREASPSPVSLSRISLFDSIPGEIVGGSSSNLLEGKARWVRRLCREDRRNTEGCSSRVKKRMARVRVRFQEKVYTSGAGLRLLTRFGKWFGTRKLVETHLVLPKRQRKVTAADLWYVLTSRCAAQGFAGFVTVRRCVRGCAGVGADRAGAVCRLGQPIWGCLSCLPGAKRGSGG